ncbi:hypothetical protein EDD63_12614 [Breznakia blatticola]|uniref:Uncharacterized protein n=1 Tax=Breznakia blatticola TaxID=1754012 RepID=A0A4R7ZM14_9FIRM|nr:hypothetical protein [Breznakia blatticola]TDW16250.1 hypothetical protein EDD63_12614 [Breznakia blatticola]
MNSKYNVEENKIIINNIEIYMDYPIKDIKELRDKIFILLDIPRGIKLTEKEDCNILCYNSSGIFQWRISSSLPKGIESKELIPYISIDIQEGNLYGFDFWGRKFHIDTFNGNLLDFKTFK